jgi:hypothetical protein
MYYASDRTIQTAADQHAEAVKAAEPALAGEAAPSGQRRFEVTELSVDPDVLRMARRLAGGDIGRLVFQATGAVVVCNSRHHAKLVRDNDAFGAT